MNDDDGAYADYVYEQLKGQELDLQIEAAEKAGELKNTMPKQTALCDKNNWPMFVSRTGECWSCNRQIEDTDEKHITGCPFCNRSFCE